MLGAMGRPRWTRAELVSASFEVLDAARWELYATRLWADGRESGSPADTEAVLSGPENPTKSQLAQQRARAMEELARLRRSLLPADDEDEA